MPVFPQVGGVELMVILVIILLFFGARRVPELARSLGRGKREFQKGIKEAEAEARAEEERERAEALKNQEESPPPDEAHSDDGRVAEEEKPKAGPSSSA